MDKQVATAVAQTMAEPEVKGMLCASQPLGLSVAAAGIAPADGAGFAQSLVTRAHMLEPKQPKPTVVIETTSGMCVGPIHHLPNPPTPPPFSCPKPHPACEAWGAATAVGQPALHAVSSTCWGLRLPPPACRLALHTHPPVTLAARRARSKVLVRSNDKVTVAVYSSGAS